MAALIPQKPKSSQSRLCPKCGTSFVCGLTSGAVHCWCFDLPPVMPLLDDAAGVDIGCLCPRCLKNAIQKRLETPSEEKDQQL